MKFTLLAHAALWIEHRGVGVLVDPWLTGTCFSDAWALLPPRDAWPDGLPCPQWIVYSHAHPDHFHVPTLRALGARFGLDLPIIVPRQLFGTLAAAARQLGFTRVSEAAADRPVDLGPELSVTVYPVRADDSLQVFRAGTYTLVNANDCQLSGRWLGAMTQRWSNVDFYLGQFGVADGYPFRLAGISPDDSAAAADALTDRFFRQAAAFGATHAIPTAGFFRFAHADNQSMNQWVRGVDFVRRAVPAEQSCTVLYPGDGWDDAGGFAHTPEHRHGYEDALQAVRSGATPRFPRLPPPPRAEVEALARARFEDMFTLLPRWLRTRLSPLGFYLEDADYSVRVDWQQRTLHWQAGPPAAAYYQLTASHFADVCRSPVGWSTLHIGCRFTVHGWEQSPAVEQFLPISIAASLGYFGHGLADWLRPGALATLWSRRIELADVVLHGQRRQRNAAVGFQRW